MKVAEKIKYAIKKLRLGSRTIFTKISSTKIINGIKNSLSYYPSEIINKPYNPIHYLEGNIFLILNPFKNSFCKSFFFTL